MGPLGMFFKGERPSLLPFLDIETEPGLQKECCGCCSSHLVTMRKPTMRMKPHAKDVKD